MKNVGNAWRNLLAAIAPGLLLCLTTTMSLYPSRSVEGPVLTRKHRAGQTAAGRAIHLQPVEPLQTNDHAHPSLPTTLNLEDSRIPGRSITGTHRQENDPQTLSGVGRTPKAQAIDGSCISLAKSNFAEVDLPDGSLSHRKRFLWTHPQKIPAFQSSTSEFRLNLGPNAADWEKARTIDGVPADVPVRRVKAEARNVIPLPVSAVA
jgi:hypothetical protein